jgi:hypothetical protein
MEYRLKDPKVGASSRTEKQIRFHKDAAKLIYRNLVQLSLNYVV